MKLAERGKKTQHNNTKDEIYRYLRGNHCSAPPLSGIEPIHTGTHSIEADSVSHTAIHPLLARLEGIDEAVTETFFGEVAGVTGTEA